MEHYDIFDKAMEILGIFFRKILSKIMLLKENGATDIQVAEIGDLMKSGIGLNLHDIESLTNEAFLTNLLDKKLKATDFSNMINLLVELGTVKNSLPAKYNSNQLLSKALFLGDYLTTNQKMVNWGNIAALDKARMLLK
ncbi:MAG TPA: hypothetical protein VGN20_06575 [Mucilaginibacter sp.]|jgi:hypothetical protein